MNEPQLTPIARTLFGPNATRPWARPLFVMVWSPWEWKRKINQLGDPTSRPEYRE
jgi:hypothetical protein